MTQVNLPQYALKTECGRELLFEYLANPSDPKLQPRHTPQPNVPMPPLAVQEEGYEIVPNEDLRRTSVSQKRRGSYEGMSYAYIAQILYKLLKVFGEESLELTTIISQRLLPHDRIDAFTTKNLGGGREEFQITLKQKSVAHLGDNGKKSLNPEGGFLRNAALSNVAFTVQQTISGTFDMKNQTITFTEGDITGSIPVFGSTSLLSIHYDAGYVHYIVQMSHSDQPIMWTQQQFTDVFLDIKWD